MAKTGKKISIPELVEAKKSTPEQAIAFLRKHLKTGTTDTYQTKDNYFNEILDRNEKNAKLISETKATQWKIINYSILMYIAVNGAVQLTRALAGDLEYRIILSAVTALLLVLIYFVARRMMDKTEEDLSFYREHSKINEDMLNMTTGLQRLANEVVSARRPDLAEKHGFAFCAMQNQKIFTTWLYRVLAGSGVMALAVAELLIWSTKAN
jgi:hypothetical protein